MSRGPDSTEPVRPAKPANPYDSGVVRFGMFVLCAVFFISGVTIEIYDAGEILAARRSASWPKVAGTILSADFHEQSTGRRQTVPNYIFLMNYQYAVDGKQYRGTRWRFGSNSVSEPDVPELRNKFQPNATVDVYYDPANPSESVLVPGARAALYLAILLVGPLLMLFGAGGAYYLGLRRRGPESTT